MTTNTTIRRASNKAARRADHQALALEPLTWDVDLEEESLEWPDNDWTAEELETLVFNQEFWDGQFHTEYGSPWS